MAAKTLTIDGKQVSAEEGETLLQAAREAGIEIPTLCHLEGVYDVGAYCELQTLAYDQGMDHVRFEYQFPKWEVDITHPLFGIDHNRCILCTRCVRVCWHIEGAGTKNVAGRGSTSRIISDLCQPWGDSSTCTSCGKCVQACPTGALFHRGSTVSEMHRDRTRLEFIVNAREKKQWNI